MLDQDYIRKAVELADGWEHHMDPSRDLWIAPIGITNSLSGHGRSLWPTPYPQPILDALAAQLVRQVDALNDPNMRTIYFMLDGFGSAMIHDMTKMDFKVAERDGSDRTMNTIKAIVDSKILNA